MAMIDADNLFCEDQILPASATTTYSDYELHFGAGKDAFGAALAYPTIGQGTPVWFNAVITEVASTGSSPTLTINLVGGSATAPTTVIQIIASAVAAATLVAGYKFSVALEAWPAWPDYMRVQLVAGNAGFSTGKIECWLSMSQIADY